jgi:hypothetical protein
MTTPKQNRSQRDIRRYLLAGTAVAGVLLVAFACWARTTEIARSCCRIRREEGAASDGRHRGGAQRT